MTGIVAELWKTQKRARKNFPNGLSLIPVREDHLAALLDIAEAVADEKPTELVEITFGAFKRCRWCHVVEHQGQIRHFTHCPYRRARELCGKGDD